MPPRRYLTRSEVARLFEVSPATVARWTREGKLPFVLTLGGQRRYVRAEILNLLRCVHEGRLLPGHTDRGAATGREKGRPERRVGVARAVERGDAP